MFRYWSIKRYGTCFLPTLEKRYGKLPYYNAHQIRSTVYQKDFNPEFLPLAYMLFLTPSELSSVLSAEFPDLNVEEYKLDIISYLQSKSYQGYLNVLQQAS
ncbi:hypothetical protein ACFSJY_08965 [Thalassotalea euphylliae]|uniref:hypothetical protein n=1 Tax=Thalassotalea euphylliae TaxID=1655234 RepID=UPI003635FC96